MKFIDDMRLRGKNVLVTGASGYIGSRLVQKLIIEEGANVVCLVNNWQNCTWISRTSAKLIKFNLLNGNSYDEIPGNIDFVYHLALTYNFDEDLLILKSLFGYFLKIGKCRFIYFSSIAVHGPEINETLNETSPFYDNLSNEYSNFKRKSESLIINSNCSNNFDWVIIRPTYVWGLNSYFFTGKIWEMQENGVVDVFDHGSGKFNGVYIDNLIELSILTATIPKASMQVFMIRDETPLTWHEFLSKILEISNSSYEFKNISTEKNLFYIDSIKYQIYIKYVCLKLFLFLKNFNSKLSKCLQIKSDNFLFSFLNRLFSFGIRKIQAIKVLEYEKWDLLKYSQKSFVSNHKAEKLLSYKPRVNFEDAVNETGKFFNYSKLRS